MKHAKKTAILASLIVIALGFVLSLDALAGMKFDFTRLNTREYRTVTHTISDDFTDICVDVTDCYVRFVPSGDGTCRVECPEGLGTSYSVSVDQGVLTITDQEHSAWYFHIGIDLTARELVVYLPQQAYQTLQVNTVSGDVSLPQDFSFADAYISTTSGTLEGSCSVSGDASVETVSGDVDLTGWTPKALQVRSTSGYLHLSQVVVSGSCQAETISGNVQLTDCDADSLDIDTVSGDVSVSLRTGKTFSVQSVSGDTQVPSDSSGGSCQITTVSGNISCTIQ